MTKIDQVSLDVVIQKVAVCLLFLSHFKSESALLDRSPQAPFSIGLHSVPVLSERHLHPLAWLYYPSHRRDIPTVMDMMMMQPFSPLGGGFGYPGGMGMGFRGSRGYGGPGGLDFGHPGAMMRSPMSRMAMGLNFSMSPTEACQRMILACNHQRWHIVQALLELYEDVLVDVRSIGPYDGTPLHAAATAGQTDIMVLLMSYGADINAPAQLGYTPLFMAASNSRPNATRLLLQAGADPDPVCAQGVTPLFAAVDRCAVQVVQILLDSGACPFARNGMGDEPLHIAARQGQVEIAQALVEAGANIHEIGAQGMPAYALAISSGFPELGEMLRTGVIPPHLRLEHGGVGVTGLEGALVPYAGGFGLGSMIPYNRFGMGSTMLYGMGAMMPYGRYGHGRHGSLLTGFGQQGAFGMGPYDGGFYGSHALDLAHPDMGMGIGMGGLGTVYDGMYGGHGYGGYGIGSLGGLGGMGMLGSGLDLMSATPYNAMMLPGTGLDMVYNQNYGLGDHPGYGSYAYGLGHRMPHGMGHMSGFHRSMMPSGHGSGLGMHPSRSMMGLSGYGHGIFGMAGMGHGRYGSVMEPRGYGGMHGFGRFDRHSGHGSDGYRMRGGRRERRHAAEDLAGALVDHISRGNRLRSSEKQKLFKRIVRNSRNTRIDMATVTHGDTSSDTLASILMTDSHGHVQRDDVFQSILEFIRSMRDNVVATFAE